MKKYYFEDDYKVKCDNLNATEIKKLEQEHGRLCGVKIQGIGYVECKDVPGMMEVHKLSHTKHVMKLREEKTV